MLDIDNAVNTAIRKVRQALRDDAEHPRYIETVPAKGYRFIGIVSSLAASEEAEGCGVRCRSCGGCRGGA